MSYGTKIQRRERNEALILTYRSGKTANECASLFGMSTRAVYKILDQAGEETRGHLKTVEPKPPRPSLTERFWSSVRKTESESDCWEWTGFCDPLGYGRLSANSKQIYAHRMSWTLANGREPGPGMFICHHCDNPKCVNPKHLYEGTPADNMRDRDARGRGYWPGRKQKAARA